MGALFIFIFISVLVISALLFFNKGEKAQEIKSILKDIYENFKELFSNLKKLFLIVKELIQSKLDTEPTQLKDEPSTVDSPKSKNSNESTILSSKKIEVPLDQSATDSNETQAENSLNTESASTNELETSSNESMTDNGSNSKNE